MNRTTYNQVKGNGQMNLRNFMWKNTIKQSSKQSVSIRKRGAKGARYKQAIMRLFR